MSTARSPLRKLQAEADRMAQVLKATARGEVVEGMNGGRPLQRNDKPTVKFAIAMDDKVLTIEMGWKIIEESSEAALAAFIVKQMREERGRAH